MKLTNEKKHHTDYTFKNFNANLLYSDKLDTI